MYICICINVYVYKYMYICLCIYILCICICESYALAWSRSSFVCAEITCAHCSGVPNELIYSNLASFFIFFFQFHSRGVLLLMECPASHGVSCVA